MNIPASTKLACWSAVGGAIAGMLLLSYGFGYMSPSTAKQLAETQAQSAVVAVLAPQCAAKFLAMPDYEAKRAALEKASGWERRDIFPKELVTLDGGSYPDSDLVAACSADILKVATK